MSKQYTKETQDSIIKTVLIFCDQISQVNYCKAYKLGLGEDVTIDLFNNIVYTIGCGKCIYPSLKKDEIIAAVCTSNGKEGMVFSLTGIYYREKSMFCESSYTEYEKCKGIDSIAGLNNDQKFSKKVLKELFSQFCYIFKLSSVRVSKYSDDFCKKIRNRPDYFGEDSIEIDKISDSIQSIQALNYGERRKQLGFFDFKEKKKLDLEFKSRQTVKDSMIESRNKSGSFSVEKEAVIKGIILYALEIRYFLDESFDKSYIYSVSNFSGEELQEKVLHFCPSEAFYYKDLKFYDPDEFIAIVDLSEGRHTEGIIFTIHKMYVFDCSVIDKVGYDYTNCYFYKFLKDNCNTKFNPYRLNHVLDKLHRITEGKL